MTSKFPTKKKPSSNAVKPATPSHRKPEPIIEIMERFEADVVIHHHDNPKTNLITLASRSECVISSKVLLIGGIPENAKWSTDRVLAWLLQTAADFQEHAQIRPIIANIHLNLASPNYVLFPDGHTFSVAIPIEPQIFQIGGELQPNSQHGFGILSRASDLFPITSQALTLANPGDLQSMVELCTIRGIPDHVGEAQVALSLLIHKVTDIFAPRSGLPPSSFEVILHRRVNTRTHFHQSGKKLYDIYATVYCIPGTRDMKSLRQALLIDEACPSELKLDLIGEIWFDYDQLLHKPPTRILLLSTPIVILSGIRAGTTILQASAALADDNPGLPLQTLINLWLRTGARGLDLTVTFRTAPPLLEVGYHLRAIGVNQKTTSNDNPSMATVRKSISCTLAHYQTSWHEDHWPPHVKADWERKVISILASHYEIPFQTGRPACPTTIAATQPHASFAAAAASSTALTSAHILQLVSAQGAEIAELRLQAASQSAALAQYQADYPALVGSLITEAIAVQVTPHLELLRDTCEELGTIVDGNNLSANTQLTDIMAYLKANLGGHTPPSATSSSSSSAHSGLRSPRWIPCLRTPQCLKKMSSTLPTVVYSSTEADNPSGGAA